MVLTRLVRPTSKAGKSSPTEAMLRWRYSAVDNFLSDAKDSARRIGLMHRTKISSFIFRHLCVCVSFTGKCGWAVAMAARRSRQPICCRAWLLSIGLLFRSSPRNYLSKRGRSRRRERRYFDSREISFMARLGSLFVPRQAEDNVPPEWGSQSKWHLKKSGEADAIKPCKLSLVVAKPKVGQGFCK